MKQFFIFLTFCIMFSSSCCFAYEVDSTKVGQYQQKVSDVGFQILNSNRIEKRIVFNYVNDLKPNAHASYSDKSITIYQGLFPYIENEAELAGILSHEIAHVQDFYDGFFRRIAMKFLSKKYEKKADKKAVDYMVKSGYSPLALIIVMNKFAGEAKSPTHPITSDRLAYMYEYIYKKYPVYLVKNEYKENIYYQNFLLTSKDARKEIREKFAKEGL